MPTIKHPHTEETPAQTQARLRATSWRYSQQMEDLARLKRDKPATFDKLPATTHMSLGMYLSGKADAKAYGIDTNPPADAA